MSVLDFLFVVAAIGLLTRVARTAHRILISRRGWCGRVAVMVLGVTYGFQGLPTILSVVLVALAGSAGLSLARDVRHWLSQIGAAVSLRLAAPSFVEASACDSVVPDRGRRRRCDRTPQLTRP